MLIQGGSSTFQKHRPKGDWYKSNRKGTSQLPDQQGNCTSEARSRNVFWPSNPVCLAKFSISWRPPTVGHWNPSNAFIHLSMLTADPKSIANLESKQPCRSASFPPIPYPSFEPRRSLSPLRLRKASNAQDTQNGRNKSGPARKNMRMPEISTGHARKTPGHGVFRSGIGST